MSSARSVVRSAFGVRVGVSVGRRRPARVRSQSLDATRADALCRSDEVPTLRVLSLASTCTAGDVRSGCVCVFCVERGGREGGVSTSMFHAPL